MCVCVAVRIDAKQLIVIHSRRRYILSSSFFALIFRHHLLSIVIICLSSPPGWSSASLLPSSDVSWLLPPIQSKLLLASEISTRTLRHVGSSSIKIFDFGMYRRALYIHQTPLNNPRVVVTIPTIALQRRLREDELMQRYFHYDINNELLSQPALAHKMAAQGKWIIDWSEFLGVARHIIAGGGGISDLTSTRFQRHVDVEGCQCQIYFGIGRLITHFILLLPVSLTNSSHYLLSCTFIGHTFSVSLEWPQR